MSSSSAPKMQVFKKKFASVTQKKPQTPKATEAPEETKELKSAGFKAASVAKAQAWGNVAHDGAEKGLVFTEAPVVKIDTFLASIMEFQKEETQQIYDRQRCTNLSEAAQFSGLYKAPGSSSAWASKSSTARTNASSAGSSSSAWSTKKSSIDHTTESSDNDELHPVHRSSAWRSSAGHSTSTWSAENRSSAPTIPSASSFDEPHPVHTRLTWRSSHTTAPSVRSSADEPHPVHNRSAWRSSVGPSATDRSVTNRSTDYNTTPIVSSSASDPDPHPVHTAKTWR